jgi:ketosteroid isomerase-like protein
MRSPLAFCVLTLALAACGAAPRDSAKDYSGAERDVAAAIEDLESAARKNDAGTVCTKLLSDRLLATLKQQGTNCPTAVKDAFKDADSLDLTVDDVSISGRQATATVTSGTGSRKKTDKLELEKVGSAWKISTLRA